jgi:SAM-dependent methyltransferase
MEDFSSAPTCIVCGPTRASVVVQGPDRSGAVSGRFSLLKCQKCGLVFLWPLPSKEALSSFYGKDYPEHQLPELESKTVPWVFSRFFRNLGLNRLCRLAIRFSGSSEGRLLDIGAATGLFLAQMRKWGKWDLFGIEPHPRPARYARDVLGLKVFSGTFQDQFFPDEFFQVITLWNVFEHLPDPIESLKKINRLLSPSGILILSLPYLESLEARLFGKYWAGWEVPRHLYLFPWQTLTRLLEENGFEVLGKAFPYTGFGLFYNSLRSTLEDRWPERKIQQRLLTWIKSPFIHLAALPYLYLVRGLGKSSLVTVLARKRL